MPGSAAMWLQHGSKRAIGVKMARLVLIVLFLRDLGACCDLVSGDGAED